MNLDLDPSSPVPLYLQIADRVRRLVALGALRTGEQLPTVRELAVQARVNRNTAARAIQRLEADGLVRTRVGQGTYVLRTSPGVGREQDERRLDERLDELIFEAQGLGVALDALRSRLDRRIEVFRDRRREAAASRRTAETEENKP